jgi:hypothetical protein
MTRKLPIDGNVYFDENETATFFVAAMHKCAGSAQAYADPNAERYASACNRTKL